MRHAKGSAYQQEEGGLHLGHVLAHPDSHDVRGPVAGRVTGGNPRDRIRNGTIAAQRDGLRPREWPFRERQWRLPKGCPWVTISPLRTSADAWKMLAAAIRCHFSFISSRMLYRSSSRMVFTDSLSCAMQGTILIFASSLSAILRSSTLQASFTSCLLAATT